MQNKDRENRSGFRRMIAIIIATHGALIIAMGIIVYFSMH